MFMFIYSSKILNIIEKEEEPPSFGSQNRINKLKMEIEEEELQIMVHKIQSKYRK